ncbi:MAG: hypothetical protein DWB56_14140 [Candidatus Jettenia sp.]|uniref:Uncharacterized protein n=1 Tax=Candidatus Jettenia caeni TaxID=247490 RepID=I3IHF1_9BACT|nr:hypothetical protein [Candidatus Jettenia sp. AMX1]MBC6930073.1 hypothetical protein [Candidatus Jettenia sp.]NUN22625.1 hypothetical protein [Candidatus Jettenia caeni]KAA0248065.1 MAG: hypothetical protein EDM77_13510 [Candidatus Jettenia sp. AMX1]MCE7881531.1 hypothetical protein [Candidatus Jettenia sp. AMX1]MCQ3928148.1 hypothetical protein [Candidatus Jettenia sp.]
MELYLQFGHGMMEHCKKLIQSWEEGTVILSPRDLTSDQIKMFSADIVKLNGRMLLDPQLYDPRANHHRLVDHEYWPTDFNTGMLLGGVALNNLLVELKLLNDSAQTEKYIIPGIYCERVDDDWIAIQNAIVAEADSVFTDKETLATICLSGETLRFEEQIEIVLNCSESWDVDGYYVVPEHPNGQYLVDDPMWLANLLILCSGLRLQGKKVVVGYCNHQMLSLASANVNAIASGTWLNVRSFPPEKFQLTEEDSTSRRVKWYYCPQTLSEYKLPFLDMGFRAGILDKLKPDESLSSTYTDILFSGAQPSSTNYSEQQSFRHYLQCLHEQCTQAHRTTFRETIAAHLLLLETAERLIKTFHGYGVRGQDRDFANIVDVNRSAIGALEMSRGFVLERQW